MKTLILFLAFVVSSTSSTSLSAQSVDKYDTETIYFQGRKYVKNGQMFPVGPGLKALKEEMKISPEAVLLFEEFEKQSNTAGILGLISIGALITSFTIRDDDWRIGLLAGGTIISFAGIPFSIKSQRAFQKAIWVRNRDALK